VCVNAYLCVLAGTHGDWQVELYSKSSCTVLQAQVQGTKQWCKLDCAGLCEHRHKEIGVCKPTQVEVCKPWQAKVREPNWPC